MALKLSDNMMTTAHHVTDGPVEMYTVDANHAVANHPDEWSKTPWDPQSADEARKRAHERKVAQARATGEPEPAPPVQVEMTEEERAQFEEWKAAREAAAERLAEVEREEAERRERDAQIAADVAMVNSSPPRPDPNRRPLTGAAKANAERKAQREAEAAQVRADAEAADAARKSDEARLAGNVGRPRPAPRDTD